MRLLFTVSVLLSAFVVIASAAVSPEKNENINTAIDKLDEKPVSGDALSESSRSGIAPDKDSFGGSIRYWGNSHCVREGSFCGSASFLHRSARHHLWCCGGLSCISNKCKKPCVNLNSRCGWGGTKCCGSLQCIHGACKPPKPPTPPPPPPPTPPPPTCSTSLCGHGHPSCCDPLLCYTGFCTVAFQDQDGHIIPL